MNLVDVCDFWARWQPHAVAIAAGDDETTWAGLADTSRRLAAGLRSKGVEPGDRVGILSANRLAWCELAVGALRAGAAVVPLNLRATTSELAYMVDKTRPTVIAHDRALRSVYSPLAGERPHIITVGLDGAHADIQLTELATDDDGAGTQLAGTDPALITFTSGTTGYPKAAVLTHTNILATINAYTRFEGYGPATTMLCCVPLAYTGGVVNNFLTVFGAGGTLLLEEFNPARCLEMIVSRPVTAMTGVPIMYESIAALPEFPAADLSALSTAITGGAMVPEGLLHSYEAKGVHIRQAYSLTEAAGSTTLLPRTHFLSKRDSAGLPAMHTEIRILDDNRNPVPTGELGEIVVRGPQVTPGYWEDPDATAAALIDGWLHTGDIGSLCEDGFLRVADRKKDMIISGGLNVYPAEIERVIAEFPGVTEVAAIGMPHQRWGETVAVVVTGNDLDIDELYKHCCQHLSDYKRPRHIQIRDRPLPRSMSGKILRRVLRDEFDPTLAVRTAAS